MRLYEIFEDDKYFYLVQEIMTGGDLKNKVGKFKHEKDIAEITLQLSYALKNLKELNILHGDIKKENILLTGLVKDNILSETSSGRKRVRRSNDAKLADFGLV